MTMDLFSSKVAQRLLTNRNLKNHFLSSNGFYLFIELIVFEVNIYDVYN